MPYYLFMPERKAGRKWMVRVLVSYILVFMLPFLLFSAGSWFFFTRITESEITGYSRESLAQARIILDRELTRMTAVGKTLSRDIDLRFFTDLTDPLSLLGLERKLAVFVETGVFFSDVLYFRPDLALFVGSMSVYSPDAVIRQYFSPGAVSPYRLHQVLDDIREPGFVLTDRRADRTPAFHLYAYPLSPLPEHSALLLFVIPAENIQRVLGIGAREKTRTVLLDARGRLIHASAVPAEAFLTPSSSSGPSIGAPRLRLNGETWLRFTDVSKETGFSFLRFEPPEAAARLMPRLALLALVSLLVLLGESLMLIVIFRSTYRPLVQLLGDMNRESSLANKIPGCPDDISLIRSTLDLYRSDLAHERASQRLLACLYGMGGRSERVVREILGELGFLWDDSLYGVLLVHFAEELPRPHESALHTALSGELLESSGTCIVLRDPEHPRLILVTRFSPGADDPAVLARLLPLLPEGTVIASGSFRPEAGKLTDSIAEAEEALLHALFHGRSALSFPMVHARMPDFLRVFEAMTAVSRELEKDIPGDAERLIGVLVDTIRSEDMPIGMVRALFWELCFVFQREFTKTGADAAAPSLFTRSVPVTMDEFSAFFFSLSRELKSGKTAHRDLHDRGRRRAERIRGLIEGNLHSAGFSLESVMEAEGLSRSGLSSLFKRAYGETISSYMGRVRMEKAMLLLESGCSVKQVVSMIGYSDPTSFIRKFRRHTGMTPKEWADSRPRADSTAASSSHTSTPGASVSDTDSSPASSHGVGVAERRVP